MRNKESRNKLLYALILVLAVFIVSNIARATTPNPGHPWTEVGDGTFAVTGPTALRTYTFPDVSTTILTDNADVTVAQGGTGISSVAQGDLLYSSAANTLSALAKSTSASRYLSNTGTSNNPAWAQVDLTNGVTGSLPLTNGGTNASLSASNGGVVYSGASAFAVLAGTATAGQVLLSGSSAAPTWSTATYPTTAGTSGNFLKSDGTNFTSTAPASATTLQTRPYNATGAATTFSLSSNTSFRVGMFSVPYNITVNQISVLPGTITTNSTGGLKICIYNEAGSTKVLDVTTAQPTASTILTTSTSATTITPGNYYIAVGCVTAACSALAVNSFTSTAVAFENGATVPATKKVYEGTATMTAGTCNSTITPTTAGITGAISSTVNARLDN